MYIECGSIDLQHKLPKRLQWECKTTHNEPMTPLRDFYQSNTQQLWHNTLISTNCAHKRKKHQHQLQQKRKQLKRTGTKNGEQIKAIDFIVLI